MKLNRKVQKSLGKFDGAFRLLFFPPLIVAILTLVPFAFFWADVPYTLHLARQVSADFSLYIYGLLCVGFFYIGFVIFSKRTRPLLMPIEPFYITLNRVVTHKLYRNITAYSLIMCTVGLLVLREYVINTAATSLIFANIESGDVDIGLRESIIGNSNVPGIIGMFNYLIPGVMVFVIGILMVFPQLTENWKWYGPLFCIAMASVILRGIFIMDRYPSLIMIILLGFAITHSRMGSRYRLIFWSLILPAVIFLVVILSIVQENLRGYMPDASLNPILDYADLGVANASLALRTTTTYSIGMHSIFGVLNTIPRGIGLYGFELPFPTPDNDWILNPAANLLAYSLIDFGFFGFLTYIVWGSTAGLVYRKHYQQPLSLAWSVAYLSMLFALCSIFTVPITGGPGFWCMSITTFLLARRIDKIRMKYKSA